jgi:ribosomal-protein-alanine N-acetyltransferase
MANNFKIRQAAVNDYSELANFLAFEYFIHRHLDWRSSLDWLGHQPFLIAENEREIVSVFASIPEIPSVSWIRLFACNAYVEKNYIWKELFDKSLSIYEKEVNLIATLVTEKWFYNLLKANQFDIFQEIIVMEWNRTVPSYQNLQKDFFIRPMLFEDLPAVLALDHLSFPPLWQLSGTAMQYAYLHSGYASIIEVEDQIIAYQISTESLSSAHLARLAVHPEWRGKLIGYHIIRDMLTHFSKNDISRITVNTQNDNISSQNLYLKCGFQSTREKYPVMAFQL